MKRGATQGFTLVEVLVALAIVTLGMAAVLGALSASADSVSYLRERTFAQWIALNRISEQRLQTRPPEKGTSSGSVEFAGRNWQWRQEVLQLAVDGVVRIDVHVRPADSTAAHDEDAGGWTASVSGVAGDALAPPSGAEPDWDGAADQAGGPAGDTQPPPAENNPLPEERFAPNPEAPAT